MGHEGPLEADLCKLYSKDTVRTLCSVFEHEWRNQQNYYERLDSQEDSGREELLVSSKAGSGCALLYAIWMTFRSALIKVMFLRLATDIFSILCPLTLRWVVLFCERQAVFDWAGYTYSLVVLGAVFCCAVSHHQLDRLSRVTAANAQAVLTGALYRKTLSLSHSSQQKSSTNDAVPVLSGEVECVVELAVTLSCLWSSPLRVAVYLGLLCRELGLCVLVGVVLLLVLVHVNSAVERKVKQLQRTQQITREESEQLVKEMLHKLQALKLLAWEPWFHQRVAESRARELEMLRILGYLTAFSMLDSICTPFLVTLSSLGVFVLVDDGNVLTPSQIFTSLCLFRLLHPPLLELPKLFPILKQARRSLCNLEKVFLTKDVTSHLVTTKGSTRELSSDSSQRQCDRCKHNKLCDSDEEREHYLFHKGSGEARRLYLRAFGWRWAAVSLVVYLCVCAVCATQDGVLCMWTDEAKEVQGLEEWRELRNSRLSAYALLGLLQALLVCCAAHFLTSGSLRASGALHSQFVSDVLHLPLHAAQTTDTRRLLQILTKDMQVIDEDLPKHLHSCLRGLLELVTIISLLIFIMPVFSLAVCPLTIFFFRIQCQFSTARMQSRHTEANPADSIASKSVKLCVEAQVSGPGHREVCLNHWLQGLNQNLLVKYNRIITESRAALRVDAVAGIALFLVTLILLETRSTLDSGLVALALICAINMREALHRYTQAASDIDIDMLSMQSVCEIAKTEKEAAWTLAYKPPFDWPLNGEVTFWNFEPESPCNLTPTLRGINLSILKGEKIGIVGREKADTDGLVNCLFRIVETRCGAVLIDNINIAHVGLHDLRSRLQIISQVPALFSGALRVNLDPFAQYTDTQVWLALERCHLKERVRQLPTQLLHPVERTSLAVSLGQRRLLCLARALLARVKILLVEEALPCVDQGTEHLVQKLIHTEFKDCTVLWLAQNPLTVTHTDRMLVLSQGHAVKFDATSSLLQQGPLFSQ